MQNVRTLVRWTVVACRYALLIIVFLYLTQVKTQLDSALAITILKNNTLR